MSDGAFFKVKSSKRSNPEARTTLDAIHNQTVQTMNEQKENVYKYKTDLCELKKKISESNSDIEIWRLEREFEVLEKKIR
jgi:peptidoglycan hydrolase CwlO-like protein